MDKEEGREGGSFICSSPKTPRTIAPHISFHLHTYTYSTKQCSFRSVQQRTYHISPMLASHPLVRSKVHKIRQNIQFHFISAVSDKILCHFFMFIWFHFMSVLYAFHSFYLAMGKTRPPKLTVPLFFFSLSVWRELTELARAVP